MARIEGIVAAGALLSEMIFGAGCVPADVNPPVEWSGQVRASPGNLEATFDAVDPRSQRGEGFVVRVGRMTSLRYHRIRRGPSGARVRDFIASAGCELIAVNEDAYKMYCWG